MRTLPPVLLCALAAAPVLAGPPGRRFVADYAAPAGTRTAATGLVVGADGFIYAAARTLTPGRWGSTWTITKYSPRGQLLWYRDGFAGPADGGERAATVLLDTSGAVIVAWASSGAAVLKLDAATGATLWSAAFPVGGPGSPGIAAAAVAPDGSVFVTGAVLLGPDEDWLTVKLDAATGATLWSIREDGPGLSPDGTNDAPASLALDADGSVLVAGSLLVGTGDDELNLFAPAVVKYDADGHRLWRTLLGSPADPGLGVRVLATGDGHAIALSNLDSGVVRVARLDGASGLPLWSNLWAGAAAQGAVVFDALLDADGNILQAGGACGGGPWCAGGLSTRKLSAATGEELWSNYAFDTLHPDPYSGSARSIALGADGTVYAAGLQCYGLFGFDSRAVLIAYDGATGDHRWTDLLIPSGAASASLAAVATDPGGDPVVVGATIRDSRASSMLTIRYGCATDFNGDGFVDFFDYDDYVACFEGTGCPPDRDADFNGDGFADFFDYDDFVAAFETGC